MTLDLDDVCSCLLPLIELQILNASPETFHTLLWMLMLFQKVYLKLSETYSDRPHLGSKCAACGTGPIYGTRYRCVNCIDYDLCATCEGFLMSGNGKVIHPPSHLFARLNSPLPLAPQGTKKVYTEPLLKDLYESHNIQLESLPSPNDVDHNVSCSNCNQEIHFGFRYHCLYCQEFDVCQKCILNCKHFPYHVFLKILQPLPLHSGSSTPTSLVETLLHPLLYPMVLNENKKKDNGDLVVDKTKVESFPLTGSLDAPRVKLTHSSGSGLKDSHDIFEEYRESRVDVSLILSILELWASSSKPIPLELLFICFDIIPDLIRVGAQPLSDEEIEIDVVGCVNTPKCEGKYRYSGTRNGKACFTRVTGDGCIYFSQNYWRVCQNGIGLHENGWNYSQIPTDFESTLPPFGSWNTGKNMKSETKIDYTQFILSSNQLQVLAV
jgi:hypothetical protein